MNKALEISARGMQAQSARLRVIAENLANQDTTGSTPGAEPYRRKTVVFGDEIDRASGSDLVSLKQVTRDRSPFPMRYDPSHPAADVNGYVKLPNVNSFVEVMDMREAERTYSANLTMLQASRSLLVRTLDMLK
jgi:flagellar basal-body rod protein FlgC